MDKVDDKLKWCIKQKKGIKIIAPNDNLSRKYLKESIETLKLIPTVAKANKMWAITMIYYARYFAVYSLLMRIGIKSEIHECTIELSKFLENSGMLPKDTYKKLKEEKQKRIESQYYLEDINLPKDLEELRKFVFTVKETLNKLNDKRIEEIRKTFKKLINA